MHAVLCRAITKKREKKIRTEPHRSTISTKKEWHTLGPLKASVFHDAVRGTTRLMAGLYRTEPHRTVLFQTASHHTVWKSKQKKSAPHRIKTKHQYPHRNSPTIPKHSNLHRTTARTVGSYKIRKIAPLLFGATPWKASFFFAQEKVPVNSRKKPSLAGAPSRQMHITGIKSIWARLTTRPDQGRRLQNVRITTSTIHTTAAVEL